MSELSELRVRTRSPREGKCSHRYIQLPGSTNGEVPGEGSECGAAKVESTPPRLLNVSLEILS